METRAKARDKMKLGRQENSPRAGNGKPAEDSKPQVAIQKPKQYKMSRVTPYCRGLQFSIKGNWYTRSDDIPWPGNTYLVYSIQYNHLVGVQDTTEPWNNYIYWKLTWQKDTGFFLFLNEETEMYISFAADATRSRLDPDLELATGTLPIRNPIGGYEIRAFNGTDVPGVVATDRSKPKIHTFEFVKVTHEQPRN